jgi:photosystem II stability/assembly factor-like uncharacterized protein
MNRVRTTMDRESRRLQHMLFIVSTILLIGLMVGMTSCSSDASRDTRWEALPGPFALNVSTVHPAASSTLVFAGLTNGEIAMSTDAGKTWTYRTPASRGGAVTGFAVDPDAASGLYALTGRGLFRSTDSASTWQAIPLSPPGMRPLPVLSFTFDPWKPARRFVGTNGHGIYRSTDGGATWRPVPPQKDSALATTCIWSIIVDPGRPDRILAAAGTLGLLTSTNGGDTWTAIAQGSTQLGAQATHLLIHPREGNVLLIGTDAGSIFRTTNGGELWSPVHPGSAGNRIRSLCGDPTLAGLVYAGTNEGPIVSRDFGESWQALGTTLPKLAATVVPTTGANRLFVFGDAFGLFSSADRGSSWSPADTRLGGATATLLVIDPADAGYIAAVGDALIAFRPDSARWFPIGEGLNGGPVTSISIDPRQHEYMYATTRGGTFRSTDGGARWREFARSIPSTPFLLVQHPWFPTRMLASTEKGIFNSTDRGNTWRESRPSSKLPPVNSFSFLPSNAGSVFAPANPASVLITADGGISWETTRYGLGTDSLRFVTLDPSDMKVMYAWTNGGGCYRSLNGGTEWSRFSPPWEKTDRVLFGIDAQDPSSFVAMANERILFLTIDGGTTWTRVFDQGLPGIPVSLAWHAAHGILIAGLRDRGVFRLRLAEFIPRIQEPPKNYPKSTDY